MLETIVSNGPLPGPISKPKNDPLLLTIVTLLTPPIFKIAIGDRLINFFIIFE